MTRKAGRAPGQGDHPSVPGPTGTPGDPAVAGESDREPEPAEVTPPRFPIVGIGASAGGLAAFGEFFPAMPADAEGGMAFVVVQHLSPSHKSLLTDLVRGLTRMPVREIEDGMPLRPGCVYIAPPNRDLSLVDGTMWLQECSVARGVRLPIDAFFYSLARDCQEWAVGIVLSGTGSDGAQGVRAIKGEGGMVMAQSPDTTPFDGMPRSAIATGLVDFVLPPAAMPSHLIAFVNQALGRGAAGAPVPSPVPDEVLEGIYAVLRARTRHDFSQYRESTFLRRIQRRMVVLRIDDWAAYLGLLQRDPAEVETLHRDLWIGVTSFFRDPEAFAALQAHVIPRLFAGDPAEGSVRVWVCGCSTGEEAYSVAILLQEQQEKAQRPFTIRVFATDVDCQAIGRARQGVFPASITDDVSPERLERHFIWDAERGVYRIRKVIRDLVVFSEQDVNRDPPLIRMDLIICRNLLIYLSGNAQAKLVRVFHHALNARGALLLGVSESLGKLAPLFSPVDQKWKLFARREPVPDTVSSVPRDGVHRPDVLLRPPGEKREKGRPDFGALVLGTLTEHLGQACLLVDRNGALLHVRGRTGKYLDPSPGDVSLTVLPMVRQELRAALAAALQRVAGHEAPVRYPGLTMGTDAGPVTVRMTVRSVVGGPDGAAAEGLFLVILEEDPAAVSSPRAQAGDGGETAAEADGDPAAPGNELRAGWARSQAVLDAAETLNEELQSANEELQSTNEELQSANEELQSANEELQSTVEELETSKEELQAVVAELAAVNSELEIKASDLHQIKNDMNNLLATAGLGVVFVDMNLRILRYTPGACDLIHLIPTDVGRPLGHITTDLMGYDRLLADVQAVLDSLIPLEMEVRTGAGRWHLMRIRPYRTLENVIEGAVIKFMDVTQQKEVEAALRRSTEFAECLLATVREPVVVLDGDLKVASASRAFLDTFQVRPDEVLGCVLFELGDHQWDIPALRRLLEEDLPRDGRFDGFEVTHDFERVGRRTMRLHARLVPGEAAVARTIVLSIEDIGESRSPSPGGGE
jgi:two-component system, chemotaxis family, CheB/CheR fusion protein